MQETAMQGNLIQRLKYNRQQTPNALNNSMQHAARDKAAREYTSMQRVPAE